MTGSLRKAIVNEHTCAVMLELVQGEGGKRSPSPDYFKKVRRSVMSTELLLILDEVQTGMGGQASSLHTRTLGSALI